MNESVAGELTAYSYKGEEEERKGKKKKKVRESYAAALGVL